MAESGGAGKGFSLSFGAGNSKARPKRVRVNEEEDAPLQEAVTGITASGLTLAERDRTSTGVDGKRQKIIPNQGNHFKGMGPKAFNPNRFLPQADDLQKVAEDDRFEVAAPEKRPEVTYGLTTFKDNDSQGAADTNGAAADTTRGRGRRVIGTGVDWEKEVFKTDVDALPDQSSLEEYEAMPVEAFGAAMLRGMGWSEEKESNEIQAKEFVRRAPLLGLGATAAVAPAREKRFIKPGESRAPVQELVVYDANGNIKHTKTAGDKLVPRVAKGAAAGKRMRILVGRHSGLFCMVQAVLPEEAGRSQKAQVRLLPSEESVTVRVKDLGEADERAAKDDRRNRTSQSESSGQRDAPPAGRDGSDHGEAPWLRPHIRVKVVDKRLGKGRMYLKKAEITDVMSPKICSLLLDSGERIDAEQHQLETVVPKKEGARIMVVAGALKGSRAKLLKRSSQSAQAAIQLAEDFSVHKVGFDDISEYVGELGEDE